jgi:hypothetical protein
VDDDPQSRLYLSPPGWYDLEIEEGPDGKSEDWDFCSIECLHEWVVSERNNLARMEGVIGG